MASLDIDSAIIEELHRLARERGTTVSAIVDEAIRRYLKQHRPDAELDDDLE